MCVTDSRLVCVCCQFKVVNDKMNHETSGLKIKPASSCSDLTGVHLHLLLKSVSAIHS